MTAREQLADRLGLVQVRGAKYAVRSFADRNRDNAAIAEAAVALRKVCRTCAHFRAVRPGAAGCWAVRNGGLLAAVPADGSGGCWHNYEERAPVAAQKGRQ